MESKPRKFIKILNDCIQLDARFTLQYLKCLILIHENEGLNISKLAELADIKLSTTSRIVQSLADRRQRGNGFNLVTIKKSNNNGRIKRIFLTAKGKSFVEGLYNYL